MRVVGLDLQKATGADYSKLLDLSSHSIVINNAGVAKTSPFFEMPLEDIEASIKTNVHPYVLLSKYAILHFIKHKNEHKHKDALIQVSSSAGDMFGPPLVYGATKLFEKVFASLIDKQL